MIEVKNTAQITTLVECNLDVKVTAFNEKNIPTVYTNHFPFTFNLTFKDYAQKSDPLVEALFKQFETNDVDILISKLIRFENSARLTLNQSNPSANNKVHNVNALTGLEHIVSLDLSGTSLDSTRALGYLNHLNQLDVSNTNLNSHELLNLSKKSNVTKIVLSNLTLHDLNFLTNNFKNLIELDLSNNRALFNNLSGNDIENLSNLKNLHILNLTNSGLTDFSQFDGLKNLGNSLVELNLSKNNLSILNNLDGRFFKNLGSLENLNISETGMGTLFLNEYFKSLDIAGNAKLKTFIYRGRYIKNLKNQEICESTKDSSVLDITSLKLLSTLETIDLHGQGCVDNHNKEFGLTNTNIFSDVTSLVTLDISSTPVKDFSGLKNLTKLKTLTIADTDGGISMTRTGCNAARTNLIPHTEVYTCELLPEPNKLNQVFTYTADTQTFVVPENVWSIAISGCSGANGGAGGGAGGALGLFRGSHQYNGAAGGDSGTVNNQSTSFTKGGAVPFTEAYLASGSLWNRLSAHINQTGANGALGTQSQVKVDNKISIKFSFATSNIAAGTSKCLAGTNGAGGSSIQSYEKIDRHSPMPDKFMSGAGAQNTYQPWSSPIEEFQNISVIPGQILAIKIGSGGAGGHGGFPEFIHLPETDNYGPPSYEPFPKGGILLDGENHFINGQITYLTPTINRTYRGNPGVAGTNGANGFVKIEWDAGT